MAIRNIDDFFSLLAEDSQRRRRELITIRELIKNNREHEQKVLCRMAIMIAYAHWEGFVESTSIHYVEYVKSKGTLFEELSLNFQVLAYKKEMLEFGESPRKITPYFKLLELRGTRVKFNAKNKKIIEANANLNYENFKNICQSVGVSCGEGSYWSKQEPYINELVKFRCSIAHGGLDTHRYKYTDEVLCKVMEFIERYQTDLENLAVTDAHFEPG